MRLNVSPIGEPFLPFAKGGFGTPSGKLEFGAKDYQPPVESRLGDAVLRKQFPLEMVCSKNDDSMNSTFGYRAKTELQTEVLQIHPVDAQARSIETGDRIRIRNGRGAIFLRADVGDVVRPGVVRAPSVRWAKASPERRNVNALTSDRLTDMGGGPVFYSCLVEVEKCL